MKDKLFYALLLSILIPIFNLFSFIFDSNKNDLFSLEGLFFVLYLVALCGFFVLFCFVDLKKLSSTAVFLVISSCILLVMNFYYYPYDLELEWLLVGPPLIFGFIFFSIALFILGSCLKGVSGASFARVMCYVLFVVLILYRTTLMSSLVSVVWFLSLVFVVAHNAKVGYAKKLFYVSAFFCLFYLVYVFGFSLSVNFGYYI